MARPLPVPVGEFSTKLSSVLGLLRPIARERLGVSVSGGVDSMTLCTLLREHREKEGWPKKVFAYTIDHNVRAGSANEARTVRDWVIQMGFTHRILNLSLALKEKLDKEMPGNLETVLRNERLALLIVNAKRDGLDTILTGHQQDDQYETVIQRLSFGSTLAGLGGIPIESGFFVRPQLDFPKARLRATCEEHKTPWVDDLTNFDKTYALRNAIRSMVQNQDDLPLALQKDNILALAVRGNKFRELLLQKVNGILQKCTVQQDMFTGNLKIDFPISMLDEPERALQHVVPAWARIHHTGKAFKFDFQGLGTDKVSPEVIDQLRDTNCSQFNIQSVSFKKIKPIQLHRGLLFVTPETPRRTAANPSHLPLHLQPIDSHGELRFRVVVEGHNSRKETMTILVHNDRAYYIRSLDNADFPVINKRVASHLKKYWNIGIHRAKGYPIARFSVLCHMEGQEEVIDALPHFRIDLSPDVKTFCNGNYNLSRRDEWREVKWIEEKESR